MCAVRHAESIIDGNICERSQLLCKYRIVLLFFLVIAQILKEQNLARLQRRSGLLRLRSNAVRSPLDLVPEEFRETSHNWLRRELWLARLRRAAHVTGENDRCAAVQEVANRRDGRAYTRVVCDVLMLIHRHVEIYADEYLFPLDVNITNCLFVHMCPSTEEVLIK